MAEVLEDPRRHQLGRPLDPEQRLVFALIACRPARAAQQLNAPDYEHQRGGQQRPRHDLLDRKRVAEPGAPVPEVDQEEEDDALPSEEPVEAVGARGSERGPR